MLEMFCVRFRDLMLSISCYAAGWDDYTILEKKSIEVRVHSA